MLFIAIYRDHPLEFLHLSLLRLQINGNCPKCQSAERIQTSRSTNQSYKISIQMWMELVIISTYPRLSCLTLSVDLHNYHDHYCVRSNFFFTVSNDCDDNLAFRFEMFLTIFTNTLPGFFVICFVTSMFITLLLLVSLNFLT